MIILLLKIIFFVTECNYLIYLFNISLFTTNTKHISNNIKERNTNICRHNYEFSQLIKTPNFNEEGLQIFTCKYCKNNIFKPIKKLIKENYEINEHRQNENFNDSYQLINEFDFKELSPFNCTGYPRLLKLSDYWNNIWLLGGNFGNIVGCRISKDQGLTWSEPIEISKYPNHICSNIDLFELSNHEIISSFRAIGKDSNFNRKLKYNRIIGSSISHNGGYTWENLGNIVDNYELSFQLGKTLKEAKKVCHNEMRIGFFEPFVIEINNKVTVFYADDFTPNLNKTINGDNYKIQNIYTQTLNLNTYKWSNERKIIMDGSEKKSPTGSGLKNRISRDGMPVVAKMKDGTYVLVFEGTYRDMDYPELTGNYLGHHKWFEILLSYSKDGIIWSNPIEIYVSKFNGTKSSAPFVLCNEKNQLIISFQTDEDYYRHGYKGDKYSIMKVMISKPGIPIEKINKNSFYALCNNNKTPIGMSSIWNGMMLIGDILYTCSSDNSIKYSKLPSYYEYKEK